MPTTAASLRTLVSAPMCSNLPSRRRRHRRPGRKAAASALGILGTVMAAGCAVPAQAGPVIQLSSAQVIAPGASRISDIYVVIRNNGPQTTLVAARISVGGQVTLRSPVHPGQVEMRTVRSIAIPARSLTGLAPNGSHLLVSDSGPMRAGTEITLTLVFAHARTFSVAALVTNPQSGGSSYFLN